MHYMALFGAMIPMLHFRCACPEQGRCDEGPGAADEEDPGSIHLQGSSFRVKIQRGASTLDDHDQREERTEQTETEGAAGGS
jgi:hypothetical protein